jgi:hypothetical protein
MRFIIDSISLLSSHFRRFIFSSTTIMEVHHHSHTARKKWTHYFWEFLMLFLAVFCGFLAENQREHYIEHQREKQFVKSLAEDLKSDIKQSEETINKLENTKQATDSIVMLLASPAISQNSNELYRIWSTSIGFADFFSNDRTIQQLKSSGALRLIRNKMVSDSIMGYDRVVKDYYGQDDLMSRVLHNQSIYSQLFNSIELDKNKSSGIAIALPPTGVQKLNEAYADRKLWSFALSALIKRLRVVHQTATRTLILIEKEYHLN